ncbi:MAG: ABC transporter substrate-binding protein [Spirochaetales bacterium]|jgi:ABC-type nitrate/sulfonate/bicarbonate transport system substrate-binding protein|nr:ABC transporter substrate-binding protein [Spirochaetales bacterium]
MGKRNALRKNAGIWALGLLAAGILLGCSRKPDTVELTVNKEGRQVYQIKTWTNKDCTAAPYIVADHLGFFEEVGLELIYTGETQSPQKIPSILSGDNDVGTGHPNTVAIARHGGAPIRAVARSIVEPPEEITDIHLQHMWWVSDKNGPIRTLEDIKKLNRKLKLQLIQRNTCSDFLTDIIWQKIGITRDQVEYITIPDVEGVQALKQGLVDIATPHPPFFRAIEDTGIANILITSRQIAGESAGTYLYYFTDDFIKKNPEPIKRFVKAIKKAERWANDNPAQTAKWTEEEIGVPVQANHYYARNAVINEAQIQFWIDGSISSGALPPDTKITVKDVITHEFDQFGNE